MKYYVTAILLYVLIFLFAACVYASWPNYRGGQNLPGTTSGNIPESIKQRWAVSVGDDIKSSPVVYNGKIVVGAMNGVVYCFDLKGELAWEFETSNTIEGPALIHENTVYIGNLGGDLYAISLDTGSLKWTYTADNQIMASPNIWSDGQREYLLVGAYDYYLHCIDAASGEPVWKYEAQNYLHAAVAIEGDHAVFGGCDGFLHVIDIPSGDVVTRLEIASYVAGSSSVSRGKAFVGDYDGMFSCVDYLDGSITWQFEAEDRQLPIIGAPSVTAGRVFFGSRDRYVYCLDRESGEQLWARNTGSRVDASVLAGRENLLVANMRGDLLLLSQEIGDIIWAYELSGPIVGSPAVSDGLVIAATQDGVLYCLEGD